MKKFHYHYWTCVPALCFPDRLCQLMPPKKCIDTNLLEQCVTFSQQHKYAFFIRQNDNGTYETLALDCLRESKYDQIQSEQFTLVFADPSTEPLHPGWPLRNLLAAIAFRRFVCFCFLFIIFFVFIEDNGIDFVSFVCVSHLSMVIAMRVIV